MNVNSRRLSVRGRGVRGDGCNYRVHRTARPRVRRASTPDGEVLLPQGRARLLELPELVGGDSGRVGHPNVDRGGTVRDHGGEARLAGLAEDGVDIFGCGSHPDLGLEDALAGKLMVESGGGRTRL